MAPVVLIMEDFIIADGEAYKYGMLAPVFEPNTIEVGVGFFTETKSKLRVGNMVIHNTRRFNWLERKMWKLLLGFDIENVEDDNNETN